MPAVPFAPVSQGQAFEMPNEDFAMMAAAQMHSEGRLVQVADQQNPQEKIRSLSGSWSESRVTPYFYDKEALELFGEDALMNTITRKHDSLLGGEANGVALSKDLFEKLKPKLDNLGDEFEIIPSTRNGEMHVRRKPRVW